MEGNNIDNFLLKGYAILEVAKSDHFSQKSSGVA